MTEIEQWLLAAMHAAVDDEQPPANLLELVIARRRHHRARNAVAGVMIVAAGALALPPAASALYDRTSSAIRPPPIPIVPRRPATATVMDGCTSNIGVQLPRDWRTRSVAAGPLWFVGLRQATAAYYGHSALAVGNFVVNIRNGATARVQVVGPAAGHFRFLFGRGDASAGVDGRYTLADGENAVTFAGCPQRYPSPGNLSDLPGYTQFASYYLVDTFPRRVSLDVWTQDSRRPMRVTFLVGS